MQFKHVLFFLSFCLLSTFLFAASGEGEKYNVIHVKGDIRLKSSNAKLKPGDVIDADDQVVFGSPDAAAALFSPSQGRFNLSSVKKSTEFGEEFIAYVKTSLVPARRGLSTRDAGTLDNPVELASHFGKANYLVLGTAKVKINPEAYPMAQNTFFYLRFDHEGESINKMLPYQNDELILSADHILQIDEQPVPAESITHYQLFYYDTEATTSQMIAEFNPVFPDEAQLKEEVQLLHTSLRAEGMSPTDIRTEIDGFLQEYFGTASATNLTEWLDLNLED